MKLIETSRGPMESFDMTPERKQQVEDLYYFLKERCASPAEGYAVLRIACSFFEETFDLHGFVELKSPTKKIQ